MPTETKRVPLEEFLGSIPMRDPRLVRADETWAKLLEPGQPVYIPGAMTDFVHAELLGELLDLWAWFVDDARDKTHPDLRMNAVGNEIRRRIMKLQGHTDEEIERDE